MLEPDCSSPLLFIHKCMSEVQHSPMLGDEVKSGNTNIKIDSDRLCKLSETKKKKKKNENEWKTEV